MRSVFLACPSKQLMRRKTLLRRAGCQQTRTKGKVPPKGSCCQEATMAPWTGSGGFGSPHRGAEPSPICLLPSQTSLGTFPNFHRPTESPRRLPSAGPGRAGPVRAAASDQRCDGRDAPAEAGPPRDPEASTRGSLAVLPPVQSSPELLLRAGAMWQRPHRSPR